jgi:cytochrome P450
MTMEYNPLSPEVQDNPFPYYAHLRHHTPILWVEPLQAWMVSRYRDVDYAIKNPQLFSSRGFVDQSLGDLNPVPEVPWLLSTDPPDHTRVRKLVNKAFTPRLIKALEPRIRAITNELLERLRSGRTCEFVQDFSTPLPVIVIAEMLGVEPERREDFKRWSDDAISATNRPTAPEERARLRQSGAELRAYFQEAIDRRRKEPREDLLAALVRAEEEQQVLSANEILALTVLLLLAGNETTTNLLGNAILTLLDHPHELAKVRADRSLVPLLVEEVLRYDSPVQLIFRRTASAVELSGTTIPTGATVFLLLGSANRDEQKFPDPDRFDVLRNARDHLAFGYGIHYCLGAELARLEARVALESLLFECPAFSRNIDNVPRVASILVRGPKTLPLTFTATA